MTFEATMLYAYWGNRREGLEAAAMRMARMLDSLEPIHPAFDAWVTENPVDEQWKPFGGQPCTTQGLVADFQADLASIQIDRIAIPGFGFMTGAWNGKEGDRTVSFQCALENTDSPQIFPNLTSFTLRSRQFGDPTLICTEILTQVLSAVAKAWNPVWATVFPQDLWDVLEFPPAPLRTGWITYLSKPLADKFVVPQGFRTEAGPDGSLIIVTTDKVFDPENSAHIALAKTLKPAFDRIQPPDPYGDFCRARTPQGK
ncbi:MAG: hypothetical protein JWO51_3362 [Rhodospirillales bacterium]|nr:hypothetical protein [Rhodospirillales bacterium]